MKLENLKSYTYFAVRYLAEDKSRYYLVIRDLERTQGAEEGYFWMRRHFAEKAQQKLERSGTPADVIKVVTNKKLEDESDHYKLVMANDWMLKNNWK